MHLTPQTPRHCFLYLTSDEGPSQRVSHLVQSPPSLTLIHIPSYSAVDADVVLLNEIGLDPGIDHCSAMSLIDGLREQGKEVVSFTSFCGGLPAPEAGAVPLGYQFSWSPKGVLSAASNSALFKLHGEVRLLSLGTHLNHHSEAWPLDVRD